MEDFTLFSWPSGTQKMCKDGETKRAELMISKTFMTWLASLSMWFVPGTNRVAYHNYNKYLHSCMGQINPNLLKKAFATWQMTKVLATFFSLALHFTTFLLGHAQKSKLTYVFRLFVSFLNFPLPCFLFLLFFYFCCIYWLSPGLASHSKTSKKKSLRWAI